MPELNLSPLLLLTKKEYERANYLLRDRSRSRPEWRRLSVRTRALFRRAYTPLERLRKRRDQPMSQTERTKLERLAGNALAREIGLHKFMVVRVRRRDGYELNLQALDFSLSSGLRGHAMGWHVSGRRLRKDGSIGVTPIGLSFDLASIDRRMLDGTWRPLTLRRPVFRDET